MDEYLTVNELSARIKFSKQSLYNLIHKGSLVLGKHYLKPTPKKILFKWSEIQLWMGDDEIPSEESAGPSSPADNCKDHPVHNTPKNLINI